MRGWLSRVRWKLPRRKALDIYFRRLTLSLFDSFDQANAFLRVQLGEQLERFVVAAAHVCPNFVRGVVDVDAALLVVPAVLCRQAHTVKQHTIEQLRVRR